MSTTELPRFLIIESESQQAEVYVDLIREIGAVQTDTCHTLSAAFDLVARFPYQVVVLGIEAAGDGLTSLERIKGLNPNASVIVVSGKSSVEEAVRMMRIGAEDYFSKPVNPESLKLALKRCLDRRALYAGDAQVVGYVNLINACQIISASLDEQRVFETVIGYLKRETACRGVALYKIQSDRWDRVRSALDAGTEVIDVTVEWSKVLFRCLEERISYKVVPKSVVGPELLVFNFKCVGNCDYFVVCASPMLRRNIDELASMFKMLQVQVQLTGKNIQNYRGVRDLLYRDDATGLHNARFLAVSLDQAFEQQKKNKTTFAVLFLDVDHFKSVNDTHGHLIGTRLLLEMGEIIRKEVSEKDTICRYGGDEFVLILPGVSVEQGKDIAERIRSSVEKRSFLNKENLNINLTVSIGIAVCPEHAQSKKDIMVAADTAMYHAKKSRRNFVYVAEYVKRAA